MTRMLIFVALFASWSASAQTDVKGVMIGVPFAESKALFERSQCYKGDSGVEYCSFDSSITDAQLISGKSKPSFTYGGAFTGPAYIHGLDGKFVGFTAKIHPNWNDKLVAAMVSKFGEPTDRTPRIWRTLQGVEHRYEELRWDRTDAIVTYEKLNKSDVLGQVSIFSRSYIAHRDAEAAKAKDRARKDL